MAEIPLCREIAVSTRTEITRESMFRTRFKEQIVAEFPPPWRPHNSKADLFVRLHAIDFLESSRWDLLATKCLR
jgi:hypothetical protein